ncbi:MAG: hypothetical protein R3D88_06080 [Alphaproteobacteria bacterium]|nr:hypothetical protein [Alphaproteobacteria bacterium]
MFRDHDSFSATAEIPSAAPTQTTENALSITQRRILYAVTTLQAEDTTGFPLTNIRAKHIKQFFEKTFQVQEGALQMALTDLKEKGFLRIYDTISPKDPIYDLTPQSHDVLGISRYQIPRMAHLRAVREKLDLHIGN